LEENFQGMVFYIASAKKSLLYEASAKKSLLYEASA